MSHSVFFGLALAVGTLALTSCKTTGDPSQGGLFGWSQGKADVRIQERQNRLNSLESDNQRQRRRTDSLQSEHARLKNAQ